MAKSKADAKPAPAGSTPDRRPKSGGMGNHWVVLQGYTASVVDADKRPDTTTKPGERRKRVLRSYANAAEAAAHAERINAKAHASAREGAK